VAISPSAAPRTAHVPEMMVRPPTSTSSLASAIAFRAVQALFGRNGSLIVHLLVMPIPPEIKRAALLWFWDRLTLCRLGVLRGIVGYGLVKRHLGEVGVRLTSGACIVTAFTAQAGFRKDPVAIAFFCLSLRFGLLLFRRAASMA
jgi:hypothetical protein